MTVHERRLSAVRDTAIAWARQMIADPLTLYLDTETTGVDGSAEIVEVSVVNGAGATVLDTLVRPVGPIPDAARHVHGISLEDVRESPDWPAVHEELSRLIDGRTVVVYNAEFDCRLVAQCGQRHGLTMPKADWHCAMLQYASLKQVPGRYSGQYRWHKLGAAAASFGESPAGHRALADALACRTVVLGMARTPLTTEQ